MRSRVSGIKQEIIDEKARGRLADSRVGQSHSMTEDERSVQLSDLEAWILETIVKQIRGIE